MDLKALWAEGFATFSLVFMGCGAIVVNDLYPGTLGHAGICLVFGLVVMAMIYSVGNISGAHLNPAVTIGFWAAGRFPGAQVPFYILVQFGGAIVAALLLRFIFPDHSGLGTTVPEIDVSRAFMLETVISFTLMFVILNVSTGHQEKGIMAGAAIGGVVALAALMAGPVTGASMNPARSLGPALAAMHLQDIWLYMLAPVLGTCPGVPSVQTYTGGGVL